MVAAFELVRPSGPTVADLSLGLSAAACPNDTWSLAQARAWVEQNRDVGVDCPCCYHPCRIYPRVLNATTARSLCWLVRAAAGERVQVAEGDYRVLPLDRGYVDVPRFAPAWVVRTNQHSALRWWQLAERAPNEDKHKRDSGMWRPTPLGIAFAESRALVPKRVFHYRGDAVGYGEEMTSIVEALGENFDYSEVMARPVFGVPVEYVAFRWASYPPKPKQPSNGGASSVFALVREGG